MTPQDSVSRDHIRQVLNEAYLGGSIAGMLGNGLRADAVDHIIDVLWEALLNEPAPRATAS